MSGLYKTEVDGEVKVSLIKQDTGTTLGFLRSISSGPRCSVVALHGAIFPQTSRVNVSSSGKPGMSVEKSLSDKTMIKNKTLSVTDLLQRAEHLAESSVNLFPLINKENYLNAPVNIFKPDQESVESIPKYVDLNLSGIEGTGNDNRTSNEIQTLEQDVGTTDDGSAEYDPLNDMKNKAEVSRKMSKPDCIVKTPNLPPQELMNDQRTDDAAQIWIGVTMEYIVFSNRLKINVSMLNDYERKKGTRISAKVFLMPGTIQKQKIDVTFCLEPSLLKSSGSFHGINGSELINREIGVRLYAKDGFFRKSKIIHEWSIAMKEIDFMEVHTAWKKVQWIS